MNLRYVLHQVGNILKVEAALLSLPLVISIIYGESTVYAFLIPIALLLAIGFLLTYKKDIDRTIYAKEGFAVVGISWIFMSLFGTLPFVISQEIPNFINAFFETVSGFSTTGASILEDVESLSKGMLFWRSLTHWIGGMGILVFFLAIMPQTSARSMFIIKAESPGPKPEKIVSRVKHTARILYAIYFFLTLLEIILLLFKIPLFDSVVHAFGTAGTGGFSIWNQSIAHYNSVYVEVVITVFMILFGINFSLFYLMLIGDIKKALKSEELRAYLLIILVSIALITINTFSMFTSFGEALRYSSFQVGSIITTTGYSTTDFNLWPTFSQWILILLMFVGASAGSTGGGIKVSRIVIFFKQVFKEIRYLLHPRQISTITFEKKAVDESTLKGINSYFIAYMIILALATLLVSIEGHDLVSTFTSVIACFNNIGPGLGIVGPSGNYASFTDLSKLTLVFTMLAGRLEIFPILLLFSPRMWLKN
ncbi:MAG: TrkH family potassium uptake protein [Acholeplasmataceae bacterium]|nr:TrkH family potassium uptake protein [Acholeplasmataceae bacterium]